MNISSMKINPWAFWAAYRLVCHRYHGHRDSLYISHCYLCSRKVIELALGICFTKETSYDD